MPTLPELKDRLREKLEIAAVSFANDYGPLVAANGGDRCARAAVVSRLLDALEMQGLRVTSTRP